MTQAGKKTVRFTQVVERSGQPHVHTLWLPPEKDPELKRALTASRVMTIEPSVAGGTTDVGFVGFDKAHPKDAQFLIFPKSLKSFEGARVVGIKFDLVEQPKFAAPAELKRSLTAPKPSRRKGKRAVKPVLKVVRDERAVREERPEPDENVVQFEQKPEEPAEAPPASAKSEKKKPLAPTSAYRALVREVHAALKELKAGKAVAAYERLHRAVEDR